MGGGILNYSSGLKIVPRSLEGKEKTHSEPGRCLRQDGGNMGVIGEGDREGSPSTPPSYPWKLERSKEDPMPRDTRTGSVPAAIILQSQLPISQQHPAAT